MGSPTRWVYDDGGRGEAGYLGRTGDCFTRSVAIATQMPYREIYTFVNAVAKEMKAKQQSKELKQTKKQRCWGSLGDARRGVKKPLFHEVMCRLGWKWTPTMRYGQGCKVHLSREELPGGRLVCRVTKHMVAVVDGVIRDTYDPSRDSTRCVYGYFSKRTDATPAFPLALTTSVLTTAVVPPLEAKIDAPRVAEVLKTSGLQSLEGSEGAEVILAKLRSTRKVKAATQLVSAFSDDDSDGEVKLRLRNKRARQLQRHSGA